MESNDTTANIKVRNIRNGFWGMLILGMIACAEDSVDLTVSAINVLPDEHIVSLAQEVELEVKAENAAGAEVPVGAVTWSSSDPSILAVTAAGLMIGESVGKATITATADGLSSSAEFRVVDLTGTWVGGQDGDSVYYTLVQNGTNVGGDFESTLGFPPITDVNQGDLTGSLTFSRYFHKLELTTENGCQLEISGPHTVRVEQDGSLFLSPGSGELSSSNCSIQGVITFAILRRR